MFLGHPRLMGDGRFDMGANSRLNVTLTRITARIIDKV